MVIIPIPRMVIPTRYVKHLTFTGALEYLQSCLNRVQTLATWFCNAGSILLPRFLQERCCIWWVYVLCRLSAPVYDAGRVRGSGDAYDTCLFCKPSDNRALKLGQIKFYFITLIACCGT